MEFKSSSLYDSTLLHSGFSGGASGKESAANAGDTRDLGSIPGSGRSPGGGNGNSLQYPNHGQRSLRCIVPWDHKESDMTERKHKRMLHCIYYGKLSMKNDLIY